MCTSPSPSIPHRAGSGPAPLGPDVATGSATADLPADDTAPSRPPAPLPALTILAHPRLGRVGDRALLNELGGGREVSLSRHLPWFSAPAAGTGEPLGDRFISRQPVYLRPAAGGGVRVDRSASTTELVVDGEIVANHVVLPVEAIARGVVLELSRRVALLLHLHPAECDEPDSGFGMVGASAALAEVRAAITRLADFDVPVLIRGETGTGKELVARALHDAGPRRGGPCLSVSLAALAPSLAAAELFGAAKGAYTGANRERRGFFERADGGTLFLDEVGEAPAELQVMLLRTLESGEILPVGAAAPRRVDVRVVSATDADLEELGSRGLFRLPLLHRLAGYSLRLPALRERRDDIGRLLVHFLRRELAPVGDEPPESSTAAQPWLPAALASRLARAEWPGNVRQLRNVARQLLIDSCDLPSLVAGPGLDALLGETADSTPPAPAPTVDQRPRRPRRRKPSEVGEDELIAALRAHRFNLKATAAALGVARTSLYARLDRSDRVRVAADVPAAELRSAFERHGGDIAAMVAELEISDRALRQRLKDLGLR